MAKSSEKQKNTIPPAETVLRIANRNDAVTISRFNSEMAKETENLDLDTSRLLSGVLGLFDNPAKGFYIVAESNGTVIGQMMITYEWSDWRNGVFWWIQSVYVHPDYRTVGTFKKLYAYAAELAKKEPNVCGFRLYVEKENAAAQTVYNKVGMKITEYAIFETDFIIKR